MNEEDEDRDRLYSILNVSSTASDSEIRESHRRLSRLFHPDKHTSVDSRAKADPKFQEIQHAFEVLSDPRQKLVYDTLGEKGLGVKLEVGHKNLTPDELKRLFTDQARQARVEELDALVQHRGDAGLSVDARSLFGGRVVLEKHLRIGSPIPATVARPATLSERLDDVRFRGLSLRNSWSIPFNFGSLFADQGSSATENDVLDTPSALSLTSFANVTGKRQLGNFGVLAAIRHQLSPKTSIEATLPLLSPRTFRSKVIHQYSPELFMTMDLAASSLACPPEVTLTSGRQITDRGVLFGTLRSGSPWKLAGWGQYGNAASYIIGWTRNATQSDPTGYTLELITGLQVLGLATDYNTHFRTSDIRMKAGGSITTAGFGVNVGASRPITSVSRMGATVTANGQSLIVKLTFSRLGQTFKLPIWIGDGFEYESLLYGVLLPLGGLIAYEFAVVQPRQAKLKVKRIARKREAAKTKLEEAERSARESVELMNEAVLRKQQASKAQNGLYITSASYGTGNVRIDVTIALAAQINDNQLIIARGQRKSTMLGFWDPAFGEKKTLKVEYLFGGQQHVIEIEDKDGLAMPAHSHLI